MGGEIENLQKLLQEDPSNFQARRELAVILANEGFNEEALANLEYLEKYFPDDADLAYNIGIINEKLKDFENAKIAYQKAIQLSPQTDFYYNLGEVLISLKEWDEAIDAFKEVLKTDPYDGNCYFNLGVCYYNKDEKNLATDYLQKAIQYNPQDLYAHFYLGNIYQEENLTNFAIESYNKVTSISPDYSWAYFNLASIAYQNGNIDEAKTNLLMTIEYNPQDIEAYKLLTKICLKDNDAESILSILNSRLKKDENGDLYYILAQVYKHIGKKEEYCECLGNALENNLTLTFPYEKVKQELDYMQSEFGIELEPDEIEEYDSEEEYEDDSDEKDDNEEDDEDDLDEEYDEDDEDDEDDENDEDDDEYDEDEVEDEEENA